MEPQAIRALAFQIASQLPMDISDAQAVLTLAGALILAARALTTPCAEERVVPLRTVS